MCAIIKYLEMRCGNLLYLDLLGRISPLDIFKVIQCIYSIFDS